VDSNLMGKTLTPASILRVSAPAGAVLLVICRSTLTQAAAPVADSESDAADATDSQIVLVTARHQAENAQDVPISLSTLTGNALERTGGFTLADIQQQVPSLVAFEANPRNSSLGIRGLGVTSAQDGMDTSVGVYLDNVYLGRPGMALADLVDVDRVEVLRGPQGTLFGRNSSAGVVNITTNGPSFTPSTTVEASFGNYTYNQVRLALTGPLLDDFAAYRLMAYNTYRDGTINNTRTGATDNGIERAGARLQLLLKPADNVSVRLITDYSIEDDSADTSVVKSVLPASPGSTIARAQAALAQTGWTPVTSSNSTPINSPQDIRTRQGGVSSQLDWKLAWSTFTSITALRFWDFDPLQDSDSTPLDIFQVNAANTSDRQATQEFRLASTEGVFTWQTGVFYFHQDLSDHYILHQYGYDAAAYYTNYARLGAANAAAVTIGPGSQYLDDVRTHADSAAVFAQSNWKVTDSLTLTDGLRYTYDRRTGTAQSSTLGTVPASLATPFAYDLAVTGHNLSSLGSLSYRLAAGSLLYASYSTGYKAAGLNLDSASVAAGGLVVQPEKDTNYEVGLKQTLLQGRLIVNADAYWTNLRGLQANYYPPSGAKSYVTNVGNIRARGAELETSWNEGNLRLRASAAFNDTVYSSYPSAPCPVGVSGVCNLTGQPVYEAPKWVANATAEYNFDYGGRLHPYILGQYSYMSSYFGTIDDSPYERIAGYGVVNARIGARNASYDVSFWVKNALDKTYFSSTSLGSINASWGILAVPGDPRTVAVTLRADF
jgi:iron complex outermembrane receptor protein